MENKIKNNVNQLNFNIGIKLDELFDLLMEYTLESNQIHIEKIRRTNGPSEVIETYKKENPKKFKNRMNEIKLHLKREFLCRFKSEMWMDHMDSLPLIPSKLDYFICEDDIKKRDPKMYMKEFYNDDLEFYS